MELLEAPTSSAQAPGETDASLEVASLRAGVADAGRRLEVEIEQTQAKLRLLETTIGASQVAVAELPEHIENLASRLHLLDQQYHILAETLSRLTEATQGIPEKTAELDRDVERLGEEYVQTRMQVQVLEDRVAGLAVPPPNDHHSAGSGDMHVIRENLDEIRRFMATLSRKL
jgi:chromosome segregation ATPase